MELAGIPTTLLEGGEGPPMVLLHGPGESAVNWRWVFPDLAETHRVIAPDLPAHGRTGGEEERLDADRMVAWLDALVGQTCSRPPVVVGHVLGGAIAARHAARHGDRIERLVLVDSLGLAPFRPSLRFLLGLLGFQARPTEGSYHRFMRQCAYDLDGLRTRMGVKWRTFVDYNLGLARSPKAKAAGRLLRKVGLRRIPPDELERISVPVALIWGRDDRALRVRIAERASERYGWPLEVIDEAADDPPRDRPEAFVEALRRLTGTAP
jgi:pimeloyl-ACP methyl ester carboxylesterase